jgi:predicted GIY-YIG superfamily endonuclease
LLMACGRYVEPPNGPITSIDCASNGPELVEGLIGVFRPPVKLPLSLPDACVATVRFPQVSVVYLLRLRSGQLYIGSTTDLRQRLNDHASGQACRTTTIDPPVALLRIEIYPTFSDARHREAQLKRWSRAKKEALIRGDRHALKTLSRSRAATPGQT